jgi:hypothetical protein
MIVEGFLISSGMLVGSGASLHALAYGPCDPCTFRSRNTQQRSATSQIALKLHQDDVKPLEYE